MTVAYFFYSEMSLTIGQYLMKLRRMKLRHTKNVPVCQGRPVCAIKVITM